MALMNPPNSDAVADIPDELVDRYGEAGWTKVSSSKSSDTKKSTASKSSSKK